jgi:hypothetical protein
MLVNIVKVPGTWLGCHVEKHRAEIGDQPDEPYDNAEFVEVHDSLFIFPE